MGDTPRFYGTFQGGGNKILPRQLIESFWTAPGGGYFVGHTNTIPGKAKTVEALRSG
jgi:hypothetical protein